MLYESIPFLAFLLTSSVVSILINLIYDMRLIEAPDINLTYFGYEFIWQVVVRIRTCHFGRCSPSFGEINNDK